MKTDSALGKVTVLLFRHGETDWNATHRFQGHSDIPLNSYGRQQALDLRAKFQALKKKDLSPQLVLSSDLSRAVETARIALADPNTDVYSGSPPLIMDTELRECYLGEAEGEYRDRFNERFGAESWDRWVSLLPEDEDFCFPGGESKRVHRERLIRSLERHLLLLVNGGRAGSGGDFLAPDAANAKGTVTQPVVAVANHGGSIRRIIYHCEGAPQGQFTVGNCALFHLEFFPLARRWAFLGER